MRCLVDESMSPLDAVIDQYSLPEDRLAFLLDCVRRSGPRKGDPAWYRQDPVVLALDEVAVLAGDEEDFLREAQAAWLDGEWPERYDPREEEYSIRKDFRRVRGF